MSQHGTAANSALRGAAQSAGNAPASPFSDPYYTDLLLRPSGALTPAPSSSPGTPSAAPAANNAAATATATATSMASRAEDTRLLARDLRLGDVPADDRAYLAQTVAAQTGISQPEAQKRVDDTIAQMKVAEEKAQQVAEAARKQAASAAIIGALALVIGAFIASASAALGGRLRDTY